MKNHISCLTLAAGILGALALKPVIIAAPPTWTPSHRVQICATIYGSFDYEFEGVGAWVGRVLVRFDNGTTKVATFVDRNNSFEQMENGLVRGTETMSVTFVDGSGGFDVQARFIGTPASTPGLYSLHETGMITNGTGHYAQITGSVAVEGPFMFADPSVTPGVPLFIGKMRGEAVGI